MYTYVCWSRVRYQFPFSPLRTCVSLCTFLFFKYNYICIYIYAYLCMYMTKDASKPTDACNKNRASSRRLLLKGVIYTYICINLYIHIHIHIHIYTCIYAHIHTHIYKPTKLNPTQCYKYCALSNARNTEHHQGLL